MLLVKLLSRVYDAGLTLLLSRQQADDVTQRLEAIDLDLIDDRCLPLILLWYDEPFEMLRPGFYGDREYALGGLQFAVEPELTNHHIFAQRIRRDLSVGGKDGYGQRQVESASFLLEVGRSHVDGDVGPWKFQAIVLHGSGYAVPAFPHCDVAKASQMVHHTLDDAHLHGDRRHL